MRGFVAILRRELVAYFSSPLAYVILTTFLLVFGFLFQMILTFLADPRSTQGEVFPLLFGNVFTWILLLLYSSTLTMRLLAEERKSGSIETLLTAPVTENQVVLAKFASALFFWGVMWSTTLAYVWLLEMFGDLDLGPVAGGYLGVMLVGAFFLSVGTFASTLAKNQVASAILSFSMLLGILLLGVLGGFASDPAWKNVWGYLTLWDHIDELGRGIVDTRRLVYYLSGTAFFLWLAARSLEVRKWR